MENTEKNDIIVFVDESGTIKKGKLNNCEYFVITLLFIKDEKHLNKVFRRSRLKVIKNNKELYQTLQNEKEIKGSWLLEEDKESIYKEVLEKCKDDFEIAVIILDEMNSKEKFRENSARTFNYLIKNYLNKIFRKKSKFKYLNKFDFIIDERNVATESKATLKEYLNTEINLLQDFCENDIDVHYYDSKKYLMLQLADFISNTFYRYYQKENEEAKNNVNLLSEKLINNKIFMFPMRDNF